MTWKRTLIPVDQIDVGQEQVNPDTWMKVYPHDGSGQYSADHTKRYIVWVDADDNDEYPYQNGVWYPTGTLVPVEVWV